MAVAKGAADADAADNHFVKNPHKGAQQNGCAHRLFTTIRISAGLTDRHLHLFVIRTLR